MSTLTTPGGSDVSRLAGPPERNPFWRLESIGQKLGLGFAIILLLLAVVGIVAYFELSAVGSDAVSMEQASMRAMEASHLQRLADTALTPVRDYVLMGDPLARDRFNATASELNAVLAGFGLPSDTPPIPAGTAPADHSGMSMGGTATPAAATHSMTGMAPGETMALSPEQMTLLRQFGGLWQNVYAGARSIFNNPDPTGDHMAKDQLIGLSAAAQSMAAFAQSIHLAEMQAVRQSREAVNRTILNTSLFLIGAVGGAVVLGAILARVIGLGISRPVAQLTHLASEISLGELDARVEVHSRGEIGELATAVERMRTSLKMTIDRLSEEDEDLRGWTSQLVDRELRRKVRGGSIRLGGQRYEVGKDLDGQFVYVKFDYDQKQIVIMPPGGEARRLPLGS